ncbi:DUF2851 family protein [Sphingobacterium suaedae]|uniref:DUF2851 family protein n=1 Tax=Sphingobacterium suaedae TaxID=1686402 RepID=A0ABW5KFQ9_9SPHI
MVAEEILQFVWQFRLFNQLNLYSTDDEKIRIVHVGYRNNNAGPDFLFCEIEIGFTRWYGHVEIHVDGNDWKRHRHDRDARYNNVVLHVVYLNPTSIYRQDGTRIPSLSLNNLIDENFLERYRRVQNNRDWIPCEKQLSSLSEVLKAGVLQRMGVTRLENRYRQLQRMYVVEHGNWERILFLRLIRSFGMKVNADAFEELGKVLDFSLLYKYRHDPIKLEAIVFGQAGFLSCSAPEGHMKMLFTAYSYLRKIHQLSEISVLSWKFLRMRPFNFPTFRLAQLAMLVQQDQLFERLLAASDVFAFMSSLATIRTSAFWETHFTFHKKTTRHRTKLSSRFMERLVLNSFIPVLFAYGKITGLERFKQRALDWLECLQPEENSVVRQFRRLNVVPVHALDSQGLLELKENYCDAKKCLQCALGGAFLLRG